MGCGDACPFIPRRRYEDHVAASSTRPGSRGCRRRESSSRRGQLARLRLPGASRERGVEGGPSARLKSGCSDVCCSCHRWQAPLPVDSGWIVPIGRPDRRYGDGRGGRGANFTRPTLVMGLIRPVGPLLSLQVRDCYLQLNTGSGTDGGVPSGEDFGSLDTGWDPEGVVRDCCVVFLGSDVGM